jgi:uncharacterized membrane protein YgcG
MKMKCSSCRKEYSVTGYVTGRCPYCRSVYVNRVHVNEEPRTHSDGGGTQSSHSWLNTPDTSYNTSSEPSTSYSSGGGDSGGGGSSGDW